MDRRDFFKRGVDSVARGGIEALEQRARKKAEHWIRPPFAKDELDFLLACTRCDACIEACPHGVIFPLPLRCGTEVVGTPALDILNKACHLCGDWPCVNVCEEQALELPVADEAQVQAQPVTPADCPPLAKASINTRECLPFLGPECGACRDSCPVDNTLRWDGPRPFIDSERCIGCGQCRELCIANPKAIDIQTVG